MVRLLHSADWQLGMTRHFLNADAQPRLSAARLDVIEQMGRIARSENCEFVVVCGDVFESNQVERQVLRRAFEKMATTPDLKFFLLPGNHDPLDASSIYRSARFADEKPANVTLLETGEPVAVADGVELIGAPWPNKHPTSDLVNDALEGVEPPEGVRILVGHGAVDVMSPERDDPRLISLAGLEAAVRAGLVHFVALGDRHSTTDVGSTGRVWYSGAPEPTAFDEVDPGNVLIVDVDADSVSVTPRRVGRWQFVKHQAHLSAHEDLQVLEDWLTSLADKDRTVVRLSVSGQLSVARKARFEELCEQFKDRLAALDIPEHSTDLVVVPDDADLEHFGLSGFAAEALADLSELAEGRGDANRQDEAVTARDALALLYRLTRANT